MHVQSETHRPDPARGSALRSRPVQVLVVDDDERTRLLLDLLLWQAGYEVRLAADAIEAGHMIVRAAPDVMIVDIHLPYMNGCEFVGAVRADRTIPFIPVIFLTGRKDAAIRAREFGAVCLLKPVDGGRLIATVAASTSSPRRPASAPRASAASSEAVASL